MATLIGKPQIGVTATFELNEEELRAMEALAGYGEDAFIKAFYEKLGKAYMERHEAGLRRVLTMFRLNAGRVLHMVDSAREAVKPKQKVPGENPEPVGPRPTPLPAPPKPNPVDDAENDSHHGCKSPYDER
jgi:hypothetical protein